MRPLVEQLGGWEKLIDAAISQTVPGGDRFEVAGADGAHRLTDMVRVAPRVFVVTCSCGFQHQHAGRLPLAIERFALDHLDVKWTRPFYDEVRTTRRTERRERNRKYGRGP